MRLRTPRYAPSISIPAGTLDLTYCFSRIRSNSETGWVAIMIRRNHQTAIGISTASCALPCFSLALAIQHSRQTSQFRDISPRGRTLRSWPHFPAPARCAFSGRQARDWHITNPEPAPMRTGRSVSNAGTIYLQ